MRLFENIFSSEKRHYKEAEKLRDQVLGKEAYYASKSDAQLQGITKDLKEKLRKGNTLESILPDAFAVAREASKRVIGEFPYPVQVLGGVLLHYGDIAEMKTGEGKTLTAVMPIYLNALTGKGAHIVTVNEYLAARDAKWMGDIYRFLGLSVGCNLHHLSKEEKRAAFACDITYTTNSELGFDYLRDNMVYDLKDRVLRGLHYAVLDEVDSILIDESRTPLIISGPGTALDQQYLTADRFAKTCKRDIDVEISKEDHAVVLTEKGIAKAEKAFHVDNFYDPDHTELVHYVQNALRANFLMIRDVQYVVEEDEIVLVDEFTGRKMAGREFSDGLHQAIQAKEGVGIQQETKTLATITYQNFFRLYDKLSGMTGTAKTEEQEFLETYNMRVYEIPTNKPLIRVDEEDRVFKTRQEKYQAVIDDVEKLHAKGQPVLVGTLSVGINEAISELLRRKGIPHHVLNAKNDADEADIIARAGQKGAVTVATNMAGRGTDIKLGQGCLELGGLAVLGTERHEAERIDNQLRGRSGRQGDPGFSRFYVSMEDDLMVRYTTEDTKETIEKYRAGKIADGKMRDIINATQKRAEGLHFDARKNTLEYDNVLMEQRHVIYEQRDQVLAMDDPYVLVQALVKQDVEAFLDKLNGDEESVKKAIQQYLAAINVKKEVEMTSSKAALSSNLTTLILDTFQEQIKDIPADAVHKAERIIFLRILDAAWIQHVDVMEHMKTSIRLRGYAQKKPSDAYREEGFIRFNNMMANIRENCVHAFLQMRISGESHQPSAEE